MEINSAYNVTTLKFNKSLTEHDLNHHVFCMLKLHIMTPRYFAKVLSPYIKITRIKKPAEYLGDNDGNGKLDPSVKLLDLIN